MNGLRDRQWKLQGYLGSSPGPAFHRTTPPQRMQPALDIVEAIAAGIERGGKPTAIVAHLNGQNSARLPDADLDFRGARVFNHVVNGFLHRHDDMMPDLAGHPSLGRKIRNIQPTPQLSLRAHLVGHLARSEEHTSELQSL